MTENEFSNRLRLHANLAQTKSDRLLVFSARRHSRFEPDFAQVGGLADRLKGAVTTYCIALATGSAFALDWEVPWPIESILEPRDYNWKPLTRREHLLEELSVRHVDLIDKAAFFERVEREHLFDLVLGSENLTFLNTNIYSTVLVQRLFPEIDAGKVFSLVFDHLFQYRAPLEFQQLVESVQALRAAHDSLVGVHLRTGSGNGWSDPTMGSPRQAEAMLRTAAQLAIERGSTNPAFYFASDSEDAKSIANSLQGLPGPVFIAEYPVQHIDRTQNVDQQAFDFAVTEFMILASCDFLLGGAGNFWHTAALVGGKPFMRA